ncbi:flagellar biosynthesis anti-sigma factor FlgM [Bacillus mesophilus]|uniref:Negative regulator of flagellin synthesis n=2 Tax=Bacillus mesophilus TaxID=1808955 RepID=A0A6M0Q7F6_9BACI|nr:flagellar biosynthesis anti-sigma factor FlgM [Bacillus mesophilus]
MKINNINSLNVNPYKKNLNKVQGAEKSATRADKVEISSAAKEMQVTSKVAAERLDKIQALKQQVEAGSYQVDAESVAKSVIQYFSKN